MERARAIQKCYMTVSRQTDLQVGRLYMPGFRLRAPDPHSRMDQTRAITLPSVVNQQLDA